MSNEATGQPDSTVDERSDRELIAAFLQTRDEQAFRAIVIRHGPLVMRVCRGILRSPQDAEDAFQATFLLLAKSAGKIRRRQALASWLYGAAYRICLKTRRMIYRRKEQGLGNVEPTLEQSLDELADGHERSVLHEELNRLPEKYRAPLVLCVLQGRSREEAARELGCSVGVIKGRLERARQKLKTRLIARGATCGAALLTCGMTSVAGAGVSAQLVAGTVQAAMAHLGGTPIAGGVATQAVTLNQGNWSLMSASISARLATTTLLMAALVGLCGLMVARFTEAARPPVVPATVEVSDSTPFDEELDDIPLIMAGAGDGESAGPAMIFPEDGILQSRSRVENLDWTGVGRFLIFGGMIDPQIDASEVSAELWNAEQGRKVRLPATHSFAATSDGATYATLDRVNRETIEVRFYDPAARELRTSFQLDSGTQLFQPRSLDFSQDGALLVACGWSFQDGREDGVGNDVLVFDVDSQSLKAHFVGRGNADAVYGGAVSPDGTMYATAHGARRTSQPGVRIWNLEDGSIVQEWPGHREIVWRVAFSPDGSRVAAVGHSFDDADQFTWNNLVSVYNIQTGEHEWNLEGHERAPQAVAFSPVGNLLASGGVDRTVRVWNFQSGQLLHTFTGHEGIVNSLAFSPDGMQLASGGRDKVVRLWDVSELYDGE